MGLVILLIISAYLLISAGVVSAAILYAQKHGKSAIRWGASAALVMFLIPGWDWIPTVAAHKYYCEKEAGFWVYKTVEQWKAENPGVMETLTTPQVWSRQHVGDMNNYVSTATVNQRFIYVINKSGPFFINVWKHSQEIVDTKSNTVLAEQIDYSTGNGNIGGEIEFLFWLHSDNCIGGRDKAISFVKFFNQFKGVEK
jgi:hypothetical protein